MKLSKRRTEVRFESDAAITNNKSNLTPATAGARTEHRNDGARY
jgi:hypothetical protein